MTNQVAERFVELPPDAPRPSFLWNIHLPLLMWRYIDLHPSHCDACIDRLSGDFVPGVRLRAGDRKVVRRRLGEVIAAAREAGVLLGLVLPGVLESGEVSSAVVLLRWHSVAPERACVDPVISKFSRDDPQVATLDGGGGVVGVGRAVVERMIQSLRVYPDITGQPVTQAIHGEDSNPGDSYFSQENAVLVGG